MITDPTYKLLYLCARQNLDQETIKKISAHCSINNIDWEHVFELADAHKVAPMIYISLRRCVEMAGLQVPKSLLIRFKLNAATNVQSESFVTNALHNKLTYFEANNFDVMFIKSIALNQSVYLRNWYTSPDDVDLIIRSNSPPITEPQKAQIARFQADGFEIDHYQHHDITMNNVLDVDFELIWRDSIQADYEGHQVYFMSAEDTLISLCINSARKRFFRLKAMVDIAESLKHYQNSISWDLFMQKVSLYEIDLITYTALLVAHEYVEAPIPDGIMQRFSIGWLKRRIVSAIVKYQSIDNSFYLRQTRKSQVLGRKLGLLLLLRYLTLTPSQIWRNLRFAWRTRSGDFTFWDEA